MDRRHVGVFVALYLLAALMVVALPGHGGPPPPGQGAGWQGTSSHALQRGSGRGLGAPEDWFVSQRLSGHGIPRGAPAAAVRQADRLAALAAAVDPKLAAAAWVCVRRTNTGGRVLDVVPDPANAETVYAAAASGGVWKSTDGGSTFVQAWPLGNPQAVGALAMSSDGTLYAGTGEAGPGGGSITYGGRGIYKLMNGGASWTNVGLTDTVTTGR